MGNPLVQKEHTHPADRDYIAATKLRGDLIECATSSHDRPRQLIASAAQQVSVDVFLKVGKQDTIRRAIQRERRGQMPKEPSSLKVN